MIKSAELENSAYEFEAKMPLRHAVPLGLQHVFAMFVGNLTPLLIITSACGLAGGEFADLQVSLLQNAMFVAGIVTLVQLYGLGPVGGKVPIIMGTSSGFLGVFNSVAATMGGDVTAYGAMMGASILGGLFESVLGVFLKPLRKLFPPVVTGTVVLSIGLSLISVGVNSFGGGNAAKDFGSVENLLLAVFVLVVILFFKHWTKGFLSSSSILVGIDPIQFPGLKVSVTSDESRAINTDPVPKVIISASGMCEAGRIRHHLKHNLWRKECTVLFVGYQAVNTLGRSLLEGADNVKLFGESIEVQAEICQLTGLSGHADREGLLKWVNSFEPKPKRVFIIHGEDEVENIFAQTLTEQGFNACAPYNGEQWAIGAEGAVCLKEGTRIRIEHHVSEGAARAATVFQRLLNAGKRLLRVIEHNEDGANKDLAKFADQINALCDKWDR